MSYQVLARKWRPRTFREMVGQEHVLQALVNALDNNRLHHAYLFTGTRGVGKTTIARILAKCLNCERGVSSEPCGECSSCIEIAEGRSVDLIEVDAASRTKVEDTRELLENVQYAPTHARYKVYLIDEVHMLSGHSFNALLKTLEEPPPHVKFLLATTDPQKLPATILSRCLQFNLKNMPPDQIVAHLSRVLAEEDVDCEEPALWLLARAANGSMRDALSLTDQAIAFGSGKLVDSDVRSMLGTVDLAFVYELLEGVAAGEPAGVLSVVERMAEHGTDFEGSLDEMLSLLHRVAIAQALPDAIDNRWGDGPRVAALASGVTAEDAQLFYQIAVNGKRDVPMAPDPRTGFEMVLLRMIAFRPAASIEDAAGAADIPAPAPRDSVDAAGEVGAPAKKPAEGHALEALTPDNWPCLLERLGLLGIVYNIASHCELRQRSRNHLYFVLDAANSSLFNDGHGEKIRLALENYFEQPLQVSIEPGEPEQETPAMRQQRRAAERQREAVAEIESDPQLQQLIARFDGELDLASIVPTDS
jgi:DNA polymerase-3 subunit gamma/tau